MAKERLDLLLLARGLFPSREQAQAAILAGNVLVAGTPVTKAGMAVSVMAEIRLRENPVGFVSRGGLKLDKALDEFQVVIEGRIALDSGASTGGFTDCLLRHGAFRVYAVDVGYGQLAWELRQDPRVVVKERINLRHATPEELWGQNPAPDLATLDLSFISLGKVLPHVWELLASPREVVALVKPQFEAGRDKVGKKGVVREPKVHREVLLAVVERACRQGWNLQGMTCSPLRGPQGNLEFWLHLRQTPDSRQMARLEDQVADVVARAHQEVK